MLAVEDPCVLAKLQLASRGQYAQIHVVSDPVSTEVSVQNIPLH